MSASVQLTPSGALRAEALAEIVERLPFAVMVWRLETPDEPGSFRLIHANPAAAVFAQQWLGKTLLEAFPHHADTSTPHQMLAVVRDGRPRFVDEFTYEANVVPPGIFSTHVFPLPENCVAFAFEKIGARRRAKEAVSRVSTVLDFSRDAVVATDLLDKITYWNLGAEKTYGWTRQEALGRTASTLLRTDSEASYEEICQTALQQSHWEGELRQTHKDGAKLLVYSQWSAQRDVDGKACGWLKLNVDITNRKQAEMALNREKEFSMRLIESSLDCIFSFGQSLRCTVWNRQMTELTGISRDDALGREVLELLPFLKEIGEVGNLHVALAGESVSSIDRPYWIGSTGRRGFLELRYSPIRADVGGSEGSGEVIGGLVMMRDTTERRQNEESLRRLSARLLQIQDDERRHIARELHDGTTQTLTGIQMNLSRLQAMVLEGRAAGILDETTALADRAAREVRTTSYLLHPPELDLMGLAGAVRSYARGFSERMGIETQVDISNDLGRFGREIETALFRIVQESLANVHRHSRSPNAKITLAREGNLIIQRVQDFGLGIPKEALSGTKAPLGVGIAGMGARIRQLGGQLQIESTGSGTVVCVSVPIPEAQPDASLNTDGPREF